MHFVCEQGKTATKANWAINPAYAVNFLYKLCVVVIIRSRSEYNGKVLCFDLLKTKVDAGRLTPLKFTLISEDGNNRHRPTKFELSCSEVLV